MGLKTTLKVALQRLKRWLDEEDALEIPSVPFDNTWAWLSPSFQKLQRDPACAKKPAYIWGCLQGAALGKVLGMERVSVIEFGVGGGAGLLALQRIAASVETMVNIRVDVYGFDTGNGLPKRQDYRDCPNLWLDNQFPMDKEQLERQLPRARLKLGLVEATVPAFLRTAPAPVAFVAIDLDLYSSTRDALRLFDAEHDRLLPRVLCYFDDIIGLTYSDYNGERLAISEFNTMHTMRKISPLYGLRYFVPSECMTSAWPNLFYFAHFFDHPLYNQPDQIRKPMIMGIDGKVTGYRLTNKLDPE
jgi:hypothetical protein